jgi:hyperosmotically inducible periplasmic protein
MSISKLWILLTLVCGLAAGSACTQKAEDRPLDSAGAALEKTKQGADAALDATRSGVEKTVDATQAGATAVVDGSKDLAATTGEAITDGWITTKVKAQFVGETLLKGSDVNVDTNNHVVTLEGTVESEAAKARASAVARETEGVTAVVDRLVVRVG